MQRLESRLRFNLEARQGFFIGGLNESLFLKAGQNLTVLNELHRTISDLRFTGEVQADVLADST